MEYGDFEAVKWAFKHFEQTQLVEVVKVSRNLSRKTASMWQNYFNLPKEEIKCMNLSCSKDRHALLAKLAGKNYMKEFYLAGGTALALHLGGYFEDADREVTPKMFKEIPWEEIKSYFLRRQKELLEGELKKL